MLTRTLKCSINWETMIAIDHNHVALERHVEQRVVGASQGRNVRSTRDSPESCQGRWAVLASMCRGAAAKRRFV